MNWIEYKRHYTDFLCSIYRAEIVTFYADRSIPSIEVKQPQSEMDKIPFFAHLARRSLSSSDPQHRTDHKLYEAIAGIIFREDKERHLCYQELPLILAYFEAFLGQTFLAIWEADSSTLKKGSFVVNSLMRQGKTLEQLSSREYSLLVEGALFDIFRKPLDSCFQRFSELGLTIPSGRRNLIVSANIRNAIIHNGGIINSRYMEKLNQSERTQYQTRGYVIGSPVPISYTTITEVYNVAVFFCQDIFIQVSKRYFNVIQPLQNSEMAVARQDFMMPLNPLENIAEAWVRKFASADEALAEWMRLKGLGISELDIIQGGNE